MKKISIFVFTMVSLVFILSGCAGMAGSAQQNQYAAEIYTVSRANFNSISVPNPVTFENVRSFNNSVKRFTIEHFGHHTATRRELIDSLTQEMYIPRADVNNLMSHLDSVGNNLFFYSPDGSDVMIIMYVEKIVVQNAQNVRHMFVNSDALNVRSGPSADASLVGQLTRNTQVQVIGSSGEWYRVRTGTIEGYVNSRFLRD